MIYDCFTFFNELDLLKIRLEILYNTVDKFVIVEANQTHSGISKSYIFNEHISEFSKYLDKIIYLMIPEMPVSSNAWDLENYQRNYIKNGLINCNPNDIIIVSDLDEIPNPTAIIAYNSLTGVKSLMQSMHYYYLNCKCISSATLEYVYWYHPKIMRFCDILGDIESVRHTACDCISDGGWHFSYLGGFEKIQLKIQSFAHQEVNTVNYRDEKHIKNSIRNGLDIFDRNLIYRYITVDIDDTYPKYII